MRNSEKWETEKKGRLIDKISELSLELAQLATLEAETLELAKAAEYLQNYQNGSPLPSYDDDWNMAMQQTTAALAQPAIAKLLEQNDERT